jgi:hypothetical protein
MGAVVVAAAVVVVALVVVWFTRDEIAVETASRCVPLPQDVTATAKASPAIAAVRYLTPPP